MLELPEAITAAKQLRTLTGRTVCDILPPSKPHKFCWFYQNPEEYSAAAVGGKITDAEGSGMYVEIRLDNRYRLCVSDGVNIRLSPHSEAPANYQLLVKLDDGSSLVFTVAMYGGIALYDGSYDNKYYLLSRQAVSPFSAEFETHFRKVFDESKPGLSAKAFLATEQRFPGVGNGVLQDILFAAGLRPRRKIGTLSGADIDRLYSALVSVLRDMTEGGGRDTERDIFGQAGGYRTKMSKNTPGCPACGGQIVKEAYLGGSVYYCPVCQS